MVRQKQFRENRVIRIECGEAGVLRTARCQTKVSRGVRSHHGLQAIIGEPEFPKRVNHLC